jgi:UDP-N-acetylmuramate dehydrogenase
MSGASPSSTRPSETGGGAAADSLPRQLGAARVRRNEPLAPYTTFRIGGPADLFYEARSADEITLAVTAARAAEIPFFLLGLGANILVGDRGYRGLVIRNSASAITPLPDHRLEVESGAIVFPTLIDRAIGLGLSGLEHYAGIPSTVGGALWQNLHFLAPAPTRERTLFIAEVTESAELLNAHGERWRASVEDLRFGYDTSLLHAGTEIALSAVFALTPGEPSDMRRIVAENLEWRTERHPPLATEPSAGSIFKKIEGIGAGRLIEECGLKGAQVGGAQVTRRHANIVVNRGNATAEDVRRLIAQIQEKVLEKTGRALEVEISFVGEFT